MPNSVHEDFICPRCGYTTHHKGTMRNHFYKKKKTCPAIKNNIELTTEIKEYVLENKIYHIPKDPTPQQIINNYNNFTNLVTAMPLEDKLNRYISHANIEILDFEDKVEEHFQSHVKRLQQDKYHAYNLTMKDMMDVIDNVTNIYKNVENFNIYYDEIPNKLKIFTFGTWQTSLMDAGIQEMIEKIKACYLDSYECYLLRRVSSPATNAFQRAEAREHVLEYYKFLVCFDILPFVHDKTDQELIDPGSLPTTLRTPTYDLQEEWYPRYKALKEKVTISEGNRIRRDVKEIVKRNTKCNTIELNRLIMDMLQVDTDFKRSILLDITRACEM